MDERFNLLHAWLKDHFKHTRLDVVPIAGDASFRRYFRVHFSDDSLIAMDAPPDKEDCRPFIAIARAFAQLEIKVPHILAADLKKGFLLLSDLGDANYLKALNPHTANQLYHNAFIALLQIQSCHNIPEWPLPHFDATFITRELQIFQEWCLQKHFNLQLSTTITAILNKIFGLLVQSAIEQPQLCAHRDYHSRNLMCLPDNRVGILDFQDAVRGPVTYDLVSLLRDCYIDWPPSHIESWTLDFHYCLKENKQLKDPSSEQFLRWFDLMGLQRHLKVLGIFSRLHIRDNKSHYLENFSRIFTYIFTVCERYTELKELYSFLQDIFPQHITIDQNLKKMRKENVELTDSVCV